MSPTPELTLYYDGLCHLCSREIEHYKERDTAHRLAYVDITAPDFDAAALGLSAQRAHKYMHARKANGDWAIGVDAFVAIWEVIPGYAMLARIARTPGIHTAMELGYKAFAQVRPLLPRRKRDECPRCAT